MPPVSVLPISPLHNRIATFTALLALRPASRSITTPYRGLVLARRLPRRAPSYFAPWPQHSRRASNKVSYGRKPLVWKFVSRVATWLGGTVIVIGFGVVGFFLYDASTYSDEPTQCDIDVPKSALQPRRGGPKNLPIFEAFIDDEDCETKRKLKDKPRLVVLGGGWGGVSLLKGLHAGEYHVTVISPLNYFLFTPMLPSATVGTLELRSLVEPIRRILRRLSGHYVRAKAEDVDFENKLVEVSQTLGDGTQGRFYVPYDKLVIAVGSVTNPHGVKGLEHVNFLKDVNDARQIRNKMMRNFELACLPATSEEERKRLLSFVICGGGPTGTEVAAEMIDLFNEDVARHFPKLLRNEISVHIIQSRSHILNTYDEQLSKYAENRFAREQARVMTNSRVKEVKSDSIMFTQTGKDGKIITKELPMGLCLWSTGVSQCEFVQAVANKLALSQGNRHALETDPHLRLNGAPLGDVYAIGDCATVQNNIADHIVSFLQTQSWKQGKNAEKLHLTFDDWLSVAHGVKKRYPQAIGHLRRLDRLFEEFDKDHSGTLDFVELRELLRQIDSKLTSLPATAQRAHQQGTYLARKFNKMAHLSHHSLVGSDRSHDGDHDASVIRAFEYRHLGSLAYVGNSAVFDLGSGVGFSGGLWAVYAWRSVYFAQSVSYRTRLLMAVDWVKRCLFGRDMVSL